MGWDHDDPARHRRRGDRRLPLSRPRHHDLVVAIVGAIVVAVRVRDDPARRSKRSIADNRTALSTTPGLAPGVLFVARVSHLSSRFTTVSASASGVSASVSSVNSGASGTSYGESMPVKLGILPARAFAYRPFTSRRFSDRQRRIDEDLNELAIVEQIARHPPLGAERRDETHQHDQSGIDHQPGDLGDAADIFDAIRR